LRRAPIAAARRDSIDRLDIFSLRAAVGKFVATKFAAAANGHGRIRSKQVTGS